MPECCPVMLTCSSSPVCWKFAFLPPAWPISPAPPWPSATGICPAFFGTDPPGAGAASAAVTTSADCLWPAAFATRTTGAVPLPSSCDHDA